MENAFVIGISYKNADVKTRSAFSITPDKQNECYQFAKDLNFKDFVVLSTCNRTEIYGVGPVYLAEKIITTVCNQSANLLNEYKYVKLTDTAVDHIFRVASGLDSQILGDYEILGQFKNACKISKEYGMLGPVFERMANICMQASKEIKTKTEISKGTVSASYATVEILKEKIGSQQASCLLIGTGKFGNNISKNIKTYLPKIQLTVSNRTYSIAEEIAQSHGFAIIPYEEISDNLKNYDVVIVSTSAEHYIINPHMLTNARTKLILDLSIPQSVNPDCKKNEAVEIFDINSISAILDKSLESRKAYLPLANEIINNHIAAFIDWKEFYQKRNQILELKQMLLDASNSCPHMKNLDERNKDELINKAIKAFVVQLKRKEIINFQPQDIVSNFMHFAQAV